MSNVTRSTRRQPQEHILSFPPTIKTIKEPFSFEWVIKWKVPVISFESSPLKVSFAHKTLPHSDLELKNLWGSVHLLMMNIRLKMQLYRACHRNLHK